MTPERLTIPVRKFQTGMEFDLPNNKGMMVLVERPDEIAVYRVLPRKPGANKLKFDLKPDIEDLELCADTARLHYPNADLTKALLGILEAKRKESNSE